MERVMNPSIYSSTAPVELDFERLRLLNAQPEHQPVSAAGWHAACHQYACFLGLKQRYPSLLLLPPAAALQLWRCHILDTRAYRRDCERLLLRFLDHLPALGLCSDADQQQLRTAQAICDELLLKHYGADALLA